MHFSPESLTAVRHAMGLWLAALNGGPGYLAPMTTTELLMKLGERHTHIVLLRCMCVCGEGGGVDSDCVKSY